MAHQEQTAPSGRSREAGGGETDGRRAVRDGMLKSVRIRNFRVLDDLFIDRLSRVNLITGRNNAGKTSLLEALFLLSGAGNPHLALNSNVIRIPDIPMSGPREILRETYWKPMFTKLDTDRVIEIEGVHVARGPLNLRMLLERPTVVELPLGDSKEISARDLYGERPLLLSFKAGPEPEVEGRIRYAGQSVQIDQPNIPVPFDAAILSTQVMNHPDNAERLSRLRKRKQDAQLLNALRIIEPKLQSIEVNSSSGFPMIWGDIELPELVPLAMMGEGMARLARLVLAIATVPGGLVLVDEIETGLHHAVMADVWRAVERAAQQSDTQVVATTHSYECIRAAHEALGSDDGFLLHRLEASDAGNRCVTYRPESIDAAMRHDLEVR